MQRKGQKYQNSTFIIFQGKSSEDAISIHVKDNPQKKNVIQAVLEANMTSLTQNQVLHFSQGVNLLLKTDESEPKVKILNIIQQQNTSKFNAFTIFSVYCTDFKNVIS